MQKIHEGGVAPDVIYVDASHASMLTPWKTRGRSPPVPPRGPIWGRLGLGGSRRNVYGQGRRTRVHPPARDGHRCLGQLLRVGSAGHTTPSLRAFYFGARTRSGEELATPWIGSGQQVWSVTGCAHRSGLGRGTPLFQWQARLSSVQRLDLAFLIAAQYQSMLRGVEVPDNRFQFLHKAPIARDGPAVSSLLKKKGF